jgi:outer membrane protein assembly factor BamA
LKKDQLLLIENEIEIVDPADQIKNKVRLKEGMSLVIRQRPNSNLGGVGVLPRYKLWRYNQRHSFYEANERHKNIKERKVEVPTIINPASTRVTDTALKKFMVNNGYYYSRVSDTLIKKKNQEAKIIYKVEPGKKYSINKITYKAESQGLLNLIQRTRKRSFIKKGNVFRNIDLGQERERLYNVFRNAGYFAFKIENIAFGPDTIKRSELIDVLDNPFGIDRLGPATQQTDSINVEMNLFPTRDSAFDKTFTYNKVIVRFKDPFTDNKGKELQEKKFNDLVFKYYEEVVKMSVIYDNIFLHPNELYATKNEEATHNRLNQLGTFQFVDIQFIRNAENPYTLDCYIDLTMAMKRDIKLNADISNGEDYFAGFGGGINFNSKNLLRGANKLNLQTNYTIEYRLKNKERIRDGFLLNANNFNVAANFSMPKFLLPFKLNTSRNNTPFTIFSLAHSRINRVDAFKLRNTTAKLSYSWKETSKKSWLVSPIFLSVTNVPQDELGVEFEKRIALSRYLQNTYSNNLIVGENISYEYRSSLKNDVPVMHTLNIGFEEAGLLMQGVNVLNRAVTNRSISPIAHYVRADFDYRSYVKLDRKVMLASRAMVGVGVPTFGDISLPYIKQYSQGGAFSNRGWQLRNLGPGRTEPESASGRQIVDRTGDLKLELNTELRFPVATIGIFDLKGASFIDAGNIWLFNEDASNPGGEIRLDKLWQDIAISSGLGLRLDFSFFVFRVDHAWRFKSPYIPQNSGWDFKSLRLNDGQWNVAIGYPF